MKLSIVIPVYNEASVLDACLKSIEAQVDAPHEVIVVDNNSSDESRAIARAYPFVRIVTEPKQGVIHARNTGFDSARGTIIGRIDADTILPPTWTRQIQSLFQNDEALSAVSGAPHYYDFALSRVADPIDYYLRQHLSRKLKNTNFLWGANMAVRRSAWTNVRHALCQKDEMHEDFDLAIHLQERGYTVGYEPTLIAGVSSRRIDTNFRAYIRYCLMSPRTYALHRLRSRFHMYPILLVGIGVYFPARFIYRGYDSKKGAFSFNKLLMETTPRVDPTSNVV